MKQMKKPTSKLNQPISALYFLSLISLSPEMISILNFISITPLFAFFV
jgi:hypothetical protein